MEGFDPKQQSQGVGDTIAKKISYFGIDKVAEAVAKLAGAPGCGCNERRQLLNELFPYDSKVRKFKVLKDFMGPEKVRYVKGSTLEITKKDPIHHNVIAYVRDGVIEEI